MSSEKKTIYYMELQPGDAVQDGDQWLDSRGQWQPYRLTRDAYNVSDGVKARRPIRTTHQTTFEEVPGSRTLQQAVEQPQREQWAYEELQPNDLVQDGDQWLNADGRWQAIVLTPEASMEVGEVLRVRRPHNITALQKERDEFQTALIESRLAQKRKVAEVMEVCKERDDALTALKSAQRARDELQRQVDELRDLVHELHGSMDEIADAGTAADVKEMLTTWATELDYSSDCFDAVGKSQLDIVQKTLITAIARIEIEFGKEADSADA